MPAPENVVKTTSLETVREVDFVSRFKRDIAIFKNMFGALRMEKAIPGQVLKSKTAVVTLNTEPVGEGEDIPLDKVEYTDVPVGTIDYDKQAVGVTLEAIQEHGYDNAVQRADDDLMYKLETKLVSNFITFVQTGQLTPGEDVEITDFQSACAEAIGQVQNAWENMDRGYGDIVGFCNTLDAYRYLGAAQISTQTEFGMTYLKDFLGFSKLFLTSKIPSGKVVATPVDNIILSYLDASANDFVKAGFKFRTDGEQNLIAVHVGANHTNLTSVITAVTGLGLWAEYLNGIAVVTITPGT